MKYQIFITILSILLISAGCSKKKKGKTVPGKDKTEQKDSKKNESDKKSDGNKTEVSNKGKNTDKSNGKTETKDEKSVNKSTDGKKDGTKPTTDGSSPKTEVKPAVKGDELKEKLILAKALVKKGGEKNYKEALAVIREILKKDFQNFEAMYLIVDMEYGRKNFEKMKDVLERIQSLGTKMKPEVKPAGIWHVFMGKYYLNLARTYEGKGMTLSAIMEKGKAEKEFGDSSTSEIPEALFHYGNLLLEKGEYKNALNSYEKLLKLDNGTYKGDWKFILNLGVAYFYSGEYLKAEAQYRHVLTSLNRQCMSCHYNLALVYGMWNEIPKIGNLSDVERAELIIKHAVFYRNEERKKLRYDKAIVDRLNKWIQSAKDRIDSSKRRGTK